MQLSPLAYYGAFSPLLGEIYQSSTGLKTYTKGGLKVGQAWTTYRLFLNTVTDNRFSIGIEILPEGHRRYTADKVPLHVMNFRGARFNVLASSQELAARLQLSKRECQALARVGNLETYLTSKSTEFKKLPEIVDDYEKIIKRYKDAKATSAIPAKTIMRLIRASYLRQNQGKGSGVVTPVCGDIAQGGAILAIDTLRTVIAVKEPSKDLYLIEDPRTCQRVIQKGIWGIVKQVEALSHPKTTFAFKIATAIRPADLSLSWEMTRESNERLRKIHEEFRLHQLSAAGLQPEHYALVDVQIKTERVVGLLMKRYLCDAFDFKQKLNRGFIIAPTKLHFTDYLYAALRLCKTVAGLHTIGRRHRDLKCENLLIEFGPNNELHVVLADFDTCKSKSEVDFTSKEYCRLPPIGVHTPENTPREDFEILRKVVTRARELAKLLPKEKEEYDRCLDLYFDIIEKGEVFALASTLHEWLTHNGRLPYALVGENSRYPKLAPLDTIHLQKSGYPDHVIQELKLLLDKMLRPRWQDRPYMAEVVGDLDRLISTSSPSSD